MKNSLKKLSFDEYQEKSKLTDLYPREKISELIKNKVFLDEAHLVEYRALCLSGEAGEFSNKVKKIRRDYGGVLLDVVSEQMKNELGDVLWYMSTLCSILKIKLGDVAAHNIEVLSKRKEEGKIVGEGNSR